jgi:hypothetical protein
MAFHDARSASAGRPGLMRGVILPHTPEPAKPLTPLSPPPSAIAALSHERDFLGPPRPRGRTPP